MRKSLVLGLFLVLAVTAWSQKISAGGGLSYGSVWMASGDSAGSLKYSSTSSLAVFGIHAFVDADYIQASIGYLMNSGQKQVEKLTGYSDVTTKYTDKLTWLDIDIVGKYPIELSGATVFPLAGIEYLLNLSYTDSNGNKITMPSAYKDWMNLLMLKAGLGADIPVSGNLYVRPEAFLGYKLIKSQFDKDNAVGMDYLSWWELRAMVLVGYKL